MSPEIPTAAVLRADILEAGKPLQAAFDQYRDASVRLVRAQDDYQRAWDTAYLEADGTEQARKSKANLKTADLKRTVDLCKADKASSRLEAETRESIVSALQSVAVNARAEEKHSFYGPEGMSA